MRIFLESASAAAFHCRSAASTEFFEHRIDRVTVEDAEIATAQSIISSSVQLS